MKTTRSASIKVGFFTNCRQTKLGTNLPLHEILHDIKHGRWAKQIAALRRMEYGSKAYDTQKGRLACFMLSASTASGGHKATDIAEHAGFLQLDVDGLGEVKARALSARLGDDPHVYASWLSPGGQGVKGALRIPASVETHNRAFKAADAYILKNYGVKIDRSCKDPCRLCFVSHDPDMRINEDVVPLEISDVTGPTVEPRPAAGKSVVDSSPSLHAPCSIAILHNTLFDKYPGLKDFYKRHVTLRIGTPQKGNRNEALMEMVSNLAFVVHPRFVLAFVEVFHDQHSAGILSDYPKGKFMREARNLLEGCLATYQTHELTPAEASLYGQIHDDNGVWQAAFRISRSLAFCESDPTLPPPSYAMSDEKMGVRLGVLDMEAWRIYRKMEKAGIIRRISTGKCRTKGVKPEASKYLWLPERGGLNGALDETESGIPTVEPANRTETALESPL